MRLMLCCLALLALAVPAFAEDAKPDAEGFISLFDGKTLNGWTVTTCKADVENGCIVILEGKGFVRSDKIYGDFVLELDWKNRKEKDYDSGVYFRSALPRKNNAWPDRYQINLKQGEEGSLVGNKNAKVTGMAKGGEWNHMRLTVKGDTAALEMNGKQAWTVENIQPEQGYIGLQVETPNGGQFEFKNIRIKPLTPPVTPGAGK